VKADTLLARLDDRARQEPAFAALLESLLEAPGDPAGELARLGAQEINQQRRAGAVADFKAGALTTAQVRALLGPKSPQAVHELRRRGRIIGSAFGNATWFPAWQFRDDAIRPDLPRVLTRLRRFTDDVVAADRIMRIERDDLDGRSIADALDDPAFAPAAWAALEALAA
jgi:hypothetical protein